MRTLILATLAALAAGSEASAQSRSRLFGPRRVVDSPAQNTLYLPPPAFPRLAAFAQPYGPFGRPGYVLPGVYNERPLARVLPLATQSVLFVISFVDPTPLYVVGNAVPPGIRLAHVLLNGSPTPGQPGQTLLFIANPWVAEARARRSQGERIFGGQSHGFVSPANPYVNGGVWQP
jgi:hypothetical protein